MFVKYPSIENHYQSTYVDRACEWDRTIIDCDYILQEKIHGANIQFEFTPEGEFNVYSRNNQLDKTSNEFYGLKDILETWTIIKFIDTMVSRALKLGKNLRFYGELFGGNVQKGVWYGEEKRILFYDLYIDNILQSQSALDVFVDYSELNIDEYIVQSVTYAYGILNALQYDIEKDSSLTPVGYNKPNIMEGVVVKPYKVTKFDHYGRPFYLKIKNETFKEKQKACKARVIRDVDPIVEELKQEFLSHLTDMRLQGIFSKFGMISEPSQIGDYIRYMHDDAKEDFLKDFGDRFRDLAKEDQKYVIGNVGVTVVPMLKTYL